MRTKGTTKYDYSEIKQIVLENGEIQWIRQCPDCKIAIKHKSLISVRDCHRKKRKCRNCGSWNRGLTVETSTSLKKMGEEHSKKMIEFRKCNPPWNKGLTKETNEIIQRLSTNHIGFKHSEKTKSIISDFSKNCWKNLNYRNTIITKLKEIIGDEEHINQWRLKMEQNGYFTPLKLKTEFEKYKQSVWGYTKKNNLGLLENYDKRSRSDHHLDHKYSITQGFLNNIPPEIIGSIYNIEMLYHKDNIKKNSKCSITKENLLKAYYDGQNKI